MKNLTLSLVLTLALFAGPANSQETLPVQVSEVTLATTKDATLLPYLLLEIPSVQVPAGMRLDEAYLEFNLDVANALSPETPTASSATLEIYPYTGTTRGKLNAATLGTSSMKRTVQVGANRVVRLYVTEFVVKSIANPNADRHLIVGSVSGDRLGRFSAKSLPGTANTKARLNILYSRIEDTSAGQRVAD